jgi:uncharacterized membrane protein
LGFGLGFGLSVGLSFDAALCVFVICSGICNGMVMALSVDWLASLTLSVNATLSRNATPSVIVLEAFFRFGFYSASVLGLCLTKKAALGLYDATPAALDASCSVFLENVMEWGFCFANKLCLT